LWETYHVGVTTTGQGGEFVVWLRQLDVTFDVRSRQAFQLSQMAMGLVFVAGEKILGDVEGVKAWSIQAGDTGSMRLAIRVAGGQRVSVGSTK
jgi:hypothetical protein